MINPLNLQKKILAIIIFNSSERMKLDPFLSMKTNPHCPRQAEE